VCPRVLRELTDVVARLVCVIFEWLEESGQICDNWKQTNIMPFIKDNKKEHPGSSKPHFSPWKVVELVPLKAGSRHVNSQHGLTKGRLCLLQ